MTLSVERTFTEKGDYRATAAAEAFLIARGFSFGLLQADEPRGILYGRPKIVAKWRSISDAERAKLDGIITGDPKAGPVIIKIFARAPAAARAAVQSRQAA